MNDATSPTDPKQPELLRAARAVIACLRFESRRSLSIPRLATWCLLALFPVGIVSVFRYFGETPPTQVWALMLFLLIPESMCLLGLLLWMAPHLQSELDGKTWPYLAVRPHGRLIVFLGKYLNAVAWTALAGLASLSICIYIASPLMLDAGVMYQTLAILVVLSSVGYGALYALFGVLIPKRATLIAVGYTLAGELLIGTLPAVVSEITFQFHFRCLLKNWIDFTIGADETRLLFSDAPSWQHLAIIAGMIVGFLVLGGWLIQVREYSIQDEA
jgi:hypothetical protein